jgi:hypothetical protein
MLEANIIHAHVVIYKRTNVPIVDGVFEDVCTYSLDGSHVLRAVFPTSSGFAFWSKTNP